MPGLDGVDLEEGFESVGEVRLHYVAAGEGPLVVLLHGYPEFWYTWRHLIPPLVKAGYRVVAPDQRGYHTSDKPKGLEPYRVGKLYGDIATLIEKQNAGKARVVAHDWGGGVAWYLAMQRPDLVEQLVILDSPHPAIFADRIFKFPQLLASWYMFALCIPILPELLYKAFKSALARLTIRGMLIRKDAVSDADFEKYREAWKIPGVWNRTINWYRTLIIDGPKRVAPLVKRTEVPVLILWGVHDKALRVDMAEPSKELVPNARVIRHENAGHFPHHDDPDWTRDRVLEFFAGT
jgi:pimeloyl-ACP methyl ester carboxylesterase